MYGERSSTHDPFRVRFAGANPPSGGEDQWTRPGKAVRDGISATTAYGTHDVLKVFTSSAPPLRAEETYTRFGYYAAVHHDGDHRAAAEALREAGYGPQRSESTPAAPSRPDETDHEATEPGKPWEELPAALEVDYRPPFPLDALPPWIAAQASQAAEEMQLTPDLASQLAVTALSIATAGRVKVRVNGRWSEWTNTYTVTALPPSAGRPRVCRPDSGRGTCRWGACRRCRGPCAEATCAARRVHRH